MTLIKPKYLIISMLCLITDQLHKYYMVDIYNMPAKGKVIVTDFFNHVMVWNRGISFGMMQDAEYSNIFFFFFSSFIIIFIFFLIRSSKIEAEKIFLSIIAGGALGNVFDRVRFGAVADFFDFHYNGYHWPAFNLADSFVFIGAFGMIAYTLLFSKNTDKIATDNSKEN